LLEVLVKCLADGGNGCAEFGKRLVEIVNEDEGKMTCVFADGTSALADAVVGCDGIKSACRPFVFGVDSELSRPRFTGKIAYRGLVSMEKAVSALGEKQARHRQMYLGHHGFMISYAVAKGTLLNVVGFHTTGSETWEGEWFRLVKQEDYQKDFEGWGKTVKSLIAVSDRLKWSEHVRTIDFASSLNNRTSGPYSIILKSTPSTKDVFAS
jgi:salicylate hydroxylase